MADDGEKTDAKALIGSLLGAKKSGQAAAENSAIPAVPEPSVPEPQDAPQESTKDAPKTPNDIISSMVGQFSGQPPATQAPPKAPKTATQTPEPSPTPSGAPSNKAPSNKSPPSAAPPSAAPTSANSPALPTGPEPGGASPAMDAHALVGSVLGKLGVDPAEFYEEGSQAEELPPPSPEEAGDLIEVYFELEAPEERDALFDQLISIKSPEVTVFLYAMMENDEDDYVRSAAAAELARRGIDEGIAFLEGDLEDPDEPFFFEQAIMVLSEIRGSSFYTTLIEMWHDPERDGDQRREAMLGMESLDLERALPDFIKFLDEQTDIELMADDQIEVAINAFLRHNYTEALQPLSRLRDRIQAASIDDPDEKTELVAFVQEGIDLLQEDAVE